MRSKLGPGERSGTVAPLFILFIRLVTLVFKSPGDTPAPAGQPRSGSSAAGRWRALGPRMRQPNTGKPGPWEDGMNQGAQAWQGPQTREISSRVTSISCSKRALRVRSAGRVRWLEAETKQPCGSPSPIACFILRTKRSRAIKFPASRTASDSGTRLGGYAARGVISVRGRTNS
jgi:hypothetical protein